MKLDQIRCIRNTRGSKEYYMHVFLVGTSKNSNLISLGQERVWNSLKCCIEGFVHLYIAPLVFVVMKMVYRV